MKFRFTLTHRGSEAEPIAIPALTEWSTQTGADEEWSEGPIPSVNLSGTFITPVTSEWLYVDFGFEDGIEYSITLEHTTVYNSGTSNPRTVTLAILDNSFVEQFSEVDTFPVSPGGVDSITLSFTANGSSTKIGFKASSGSDVSVVVNEVSGTGTDPGDITESIEINEPDGWKEAVMKLARDKEFHSLVEFFDGSFIFYGDNGVVNGGLDFIEYYEITRGVDVNLEILIEIAPDDETYEQCFFGQLDLSLAERLPKNKFRIPIIRDNFWSKFNSRIKTPVDLQAAVDLDGNPVTPVEPAEIILTDQKVTYFSDYNWLYTMTYPGDPDLRYLILSFEEELKGDIKLFSLVRQAVDPDTQQILGLFEAPWNGTYRIQMRIVASKFDSPDWEQSTQTRVRIKKTNDYSPFSVGFDPFVPYQYTGEITNGTDDALIYDIDQEFTMAKGEQLSIMLRAEFDANITVFGREQITWLEVDVATTHPITLSGEQTIDGVLTSASRVLVKDQGNKYENGVYVTGAGAWTRATDMDTADEFNNAAVYVSGGDNQTATGWRQTEPVGTVGVDAVVFMFAEPSDEWQKAFDAVYDTGNYVLGTGPGDQPTSDVFTDRTTPGSFIKITAVTVYPSTTSTGFLVHDVAAAILKAYGLGEDNPFYSELLGSALTNARTYEQDGCAWMYILLRGLQIRGYTLTEKPISMSFEQWWKGADPIFCLALWYDQIAGSTITPIASVIADLSTDWDDAGGTFPGAWNYAVFSYPFTSVNGDGGVEGYTRGDWATVAGQAYVVTTVVEIFETGTNPTNITFIWAILDASDNEIVTEQFTYTTDGFHHEVFVITPPSNGTRFGVRIINDTVSDTKSLAIRLAIGEETEQLLSNPSFDSASSWTNEGAGTDWTVGSGIATVTLAAGSSKVLTQAFSNPDVGTYYFVGEYTASDIGGGESIDITINFLDSGDNVISTKTEPDFNNNTKVWAWDFTSIVPIVKIEIIVEITAGTDITFETPYASLYVVTTPEPIVTTDQQVIRVEEREQVFLEEMSVLISNIEDISRKYDTEKIYNKIEIGYNQWQSEDISGIDDPQAKRTYVPRFQKVGQSISVMSDYIAASLAIETTRRQTIEKSTDYKFDNNTFIIAINPDDVSPDSYVPELDENFSDVLNLLNSETRYNIRLSVARNFLRWRKWFNGCLQSYLTSFYRFVSGEGNFDMVTTMVDTSPDCLEEDNQGEPLSEKQDIDVTDTIIHTPFYYEFEIEMEWETYKTIRENRRNAIGISLTDFGHVPLFIDQLDYQVMGGKAKITGWTKEYFALDVIEGNAATQDCFPSTECDNPITDELEENLTTATGVCITA